MFKRLLSPEALSLFDGCSIFLPDEPLGMIKPFVEKSLYNLMPRLKHISPDICWQVAYYLSMLRCFRLLKFTCQNKTGSSNMVKRWVNLLIMAAVGAINIKISIVSVAFLGDAHHQKETAKLFT